MRLSIKRTKANCGECPLDGACNKVWGVSDSENPLFIALGEAPGEKEDAEKTPFVGPAGGILKRNIARLGIAMRKVYFTNVISCRPPKNKIDSMEAEEAKKNCRPGLEQELSELHAKGVTTILAMGSTAVSALGISGSITKIRGSVFPVTIAGKDFVVIASLHPSYLLRGQMKEEPTFAADIEKTYKIATEGWQPPKENFTMFPSIEWLEEVTERLTKYRAPLAVDLETTSFAPPFGHILVAGIATDSETAFSIPFKSQGGRPYWEDTDAEERAEACLRRLMYYCPTIYQNAPFDVTYLRWHLFPPQDRIDDVLLMHHAISPELPHSLGYIVSVYGETPYWKDDVLDNPKSMSAMDDETLRRYNLRDCVVLHQVMPKLQAEMRELGVDHVYENISRKLILPTVAMTEAGMRMDDKRLKAWRKEVSDGLKKAEAELRELLTVSEHFNFSSTEHMQYLLFGNAPNSYRKSNSELAKYADNPKLKTNTKKYRELVEKVDIVDNTTPFCRVSGHKPITTASGSLAINDQSLLSLQIAATNRIKQIEKFKNPREYHEAEKTELHQMLETIELYRKYQKYSKLKSTYTEFPDWKDGKVHARYTIHGTATGRLSSRNPNWLNVEKEAKKVFTPEPGNAFVQGDYDSIELWIQAYESGDDVLLQQLIDYQNGTGPKVHVYNTKTLFGIDENHELWSPAYRASKVYIYGRMYGGGLRGIFEKVASDVPSLGLTYATFKSADEAYMGAHPAYVKWRDKIIVQARNDRKSVTAYGRVRYLLGNPGDIEREALNTPIQGTAADVENESIIDFHNEAPSYMRLVSAVYDSMMIECPEDRIDETARFLKNIMERPRKLWDREVSFPTALEYSHLSWHDDDMHDWE